MQILEIIKEPMTKAQLLELSPIVLAFVGDAVHTLYVRNDIVKSKNLMVGKQHEKASKRCRASHQAQIYDNIYLILTEEEHGVLRRGKNAKTNNIAKNADVKDYKKATALECLIGWLWLQGDYERMSDILAYDKE